MPVSKPNSFLPSISNNPLSPLHLQQLPLNYFVVRPWDRGLSQPALPGIASRHLDQSTPVAIFTDSQSLCMALLGSSPDLGTLRLFINNTVALSHI